MHNYFLLILFMSSFVYANIFKVNCSIPYENEVSNRVCEDVKLYKANETLENFIELYLKTLTKEETKELEQHVQSWKKKEYSCLKETNMKGCLQELYLNIRDEIKEKYIKNHKIISINYFYEQFHQVYKKKIFNRTTTVDFLNEHGQSRQCTNNQEEKIIIGYALLVQFYFTLEDFFKKSLFWESKDRESLLSNYSLKKESLIAYTLNRVSMEKVQMALSEFLGLLSEKEILSLYEYVKALDDSYFNRSFNEGKACNFYFSVKPSSEEYRLGISEKPIYEQMNAFWNRRLYDKTEKKVYKLVQFGLLIMEKKLLRKNILPSTEKATSPSSTLYTNTRFNFSVDYPSE